MIKNIILCLASGFATGAFGVGGGSFAYPLLNGIFHDGRKAMENICLFVLPLTVVACILNSVKAPVKQLLLSSIGALFGGAVGALISKKIKMKYLKIIFGLLIIYIGIKGVIT